VFMCYVFILLCDDVLITITIVNNNNNDNNNNINHTILQQQYSLENYGNITRENFNAIVTPYDFTNTYWVAFKAAVQEGGAKGVMVNYCVCVCMCVCVCVYALYVRVCMFLYGVYMYYGMHVCSCVFHIC